MATALDTLLIGEMTAGINAPSVEQAGYTVRVNAAGDNLEYISPFQELSASGAWNGSAESLLVSGSGARAITLPNADRAGRILNVSDVAGTAGAGTITITAVGTIGGAASSTITVNYSARKLMYVGSNNWVVL